MGYTCRELAYGGHLLDLFHQLFLLYLYKALACHVHYYLQDAPWHSALPEYGYGYYLKAFLRAIFFKGELVMGRRAQVDGPACRTDLAELLAVAGYPVTGPSLPDVRAEPASGLQVHPLYPVAAIYEDDSRVQVIKRLFYLHLFPVIP